MNTQIFDAALGMTPPWYVSDVDFDQAGKILTLRVGFKRSRQLLHQTAVLQDVECLLFALPILSAHYHEIVAGPSRHPQGLVSAETLLHQAFQIVSELVDADCDHVLYLYGDAVRV